MQRIYSMGKNKFITLDSYHASRENLASKVLQVVFVIIIASVTGSAMVGVDLIQLPSTNNNARTR